MLENYSDYAKNLKPKKDYASLYKVWGSLIAVSILFSGVCYYQSQKINQLSEQIQSSKKVYVYDLQEALKGLKIDTLNAEFENRINVLNREVLSAQDKISSLKDYKVKENFSDVYLNSLKMKRDTMINDYNEALQDITMQINDNLVKIAEEKNTPTIFNKQSISAMTKDVEDITQELVDKIKINKAKNLLR